MDVWEDGCGGGCVGGWEVGWVDVWDKWMRERIQSMCGVSDFKLVSHMRLVASPPFSIFPPPSAQR